ncbi:MAG: hypothetical protein ACREKM_02035 [Longimicrobiales bacterium]
MTDPTARQQSRTRTMFRGARMTAAVLLALQLAGCYTYSTARTQPGAGDRVRARLTPGGSVWLAENFGRSRETLDGTFVRRDTASIVFTTWRSDLPSRTQFSTSIDTLRIPRAHVAALEERTLSVGRTALAAAVATGLVVLVVSALSGAGGSGDGDGGGTPFLVMPLPLPIAR